MSGIHNLISGMFANVRAFLLIVRTKLKKLIFELLINDEYRIFITKILNDC
jgi:hypothetical protein